MRGQIAALFTAVLTIAGAGLGPVAVGLITDYVLGDATAIGTAIAVTCVAASKVGLLLFRSGFATYGHPRRRGRLARPATQPAEPGVAPGGGSRRRTDDPFSRGPRAAPVRAAGPSLWARAPRSPAPAAFPP